MEASVALVIAATSDMALKEDARLLYGEMGHIYTTSGKDLQYLLG